MAGDPFRYLDANLLRELHAVVVAARCPPKPLLSGIDARFVTSLDDHASEAAALLATLHRLNETPHLTEGEVPFEFWLGNASTLLGHLPDAAAVVERALGEVRRQRGAREQPEAPAPSDARAHVRLGPASTHAPSGDNYLVIIRHPDATLIGQRRVLTQDLTRIGRGDKDVDWVLMHQRISRQQCHVERRGDRWVLRDLGSANGTWVNEDRLNDKAERELGAGDRIRFGEVVLRFFGGEGALSNCLRTLFHGGPVDGLTGLPSWARILDALDVAMVAAELAGRKVGVLAIYVDQMDRLDDDESEPIGDRILQELARVLESTLCPGDIVGRLLGHAFLMVLPDTASWSRHQMASRVLSAVRSHVWCAEGKRLQVTVSIGLATSLDEARSVASDALIRGGDGSWSLDAVIEEENCTDTSARSAENMIRCGSFYVFGIGDEEAVIQLGHATLNLWQSQLSHVVRSSALINSRTCCYTSFKGHVFAALSGQERQFVQQVQTRWASLPVPLLHQRTLARSLRSALRFATLSRREVRDYGMRSYDVLLERLQQRSTGYLPFPLEALGAIALTHPSEYARAKTLCDAIDVALRFITAVEFAALRDMNDAAVRAEVAAVLSGHRAGQPLTMTAWRALAFQLTRLAVRYLRGPLEEAAHWLSESLSHALEETEIRSARYLSRAPLQHESIYTPDRAFFEAVLDRLTQAMRPLTQLRLMSVSGIDGYDEDEGTTSYNLYLHQGPSERFPLVQQSLAAKLAKNDWCYLIGAPEQPPLLLAPMVAARPCVDCGRVELFMADSLVLGPKGAKVRVKAITTAHEAEVQVPSSKAGQLLYEAVMR